MPGSSPSRSSRCADGPELGVIEGNHVAETSGARLSADAKLSSSSSGDVWVLGGGRLQRLARADPEPALGAAWSTTLASIFARACSSCHLFDGVSGTDLSSAQAWQFERSAIHERVIVRRTMPPEGHALSDADRERIRAWTESKP